MNGSRQSDPPELAALTQQLEDMATGNATAEAFLGTLAGALFPEALPDLSRVTWRERGQAGAGPAGLDARSAEARFRTLVEQIPAVTFLAVLGEGKNEVYVSPHIEQMLGFSQQEWLEAPFLWYWQLHPDDRELWNQEFARGCQTGGPFKAECRFIARDGRVVWVHGEARLVKDELGRPLLLQGIAFDITESKRAQDVLIQQATREAKQQEELAIAQRVQTSILPKNFDVEGLEISAAMVPATEVGGDYYDVQLAQGGGAWLAIGDVSGHGLDAGLVMLMLQSSLAALVRAAPGASPREVLIRVNDLLFENIRSRLKHDDHVTLSLFRYWPDGRLTFAGAHEEVLIRRKATGQVESVATPGTWVGGMRDIAPVTVDSALQLQPGDVVLLYTDGLTEATNADGEMLDIDRVRALLEKVGDESCQAIRDRFLAEARAWMTTQADDLSLLVLRYLGAGAPRAATPVAPAEISLAGPARFAVTSLYEGATDPALVPELTVSHPRVGRLSYRASRRGTDLALALSGLAETPDQQPLRELLAAAHAFATAEGVARVELDLREVRFMNSSCFKELITWLQAAKGLAPGRRYRVRLVANPLVRWQRAGVTALVTFGGDLMTV